MNISFDDVKKAFDFERLFSAITEGITIEKKNSPTIKIINMKNISIKYQNILLNKF